MVFFSDVTLRMLADNSATVKSRSDALVEAYFKLAYRSPRGREYAWHGFSRRMMMLVRCIDRVFRLIPPHQLPDEDNVIDATVNIQAFVFNAFGALDNLAWIWVSERHITSAKGAALSAGQIGLGKGCKLVRGSFSQAMQDYLVDLEPWFEHIEDFRHALAHRIPLYVPPFVVPDAQQAAYDDVDVRKWATRDVAEYERLKAEQLALVEFRPIMTHKLYDKKPPVVFHIQLLNDFATVEEIGRKMLEELALLPP